MKGFWLLVAFSLELSLGSTYCPEKCLCLWYADRSLTINCSGSEQTEVPYGIDPQVKVLVLSNNEIRSYNHSKYLKAVEEIDLSNNKISQAYFGGSFKYLQSIDLSRNFISDLKQIDVEKLTRLKTLNLSHNSKLKKVSGLKSESLEHLDLSHCFLPLVEEDFLADLPSLRSLDVSHNSFRSLSDVRSESLEVLNASHGSLENLTRSDIFNLPILTKLNVSFNPKLKIDFSYENSCWGVKELDLSNSELESIDEMFPFCSLEVLDASLNKIRVVEVRTFFNNCELVFVNLSKNRISEIHSRSFFTTEKLKILDLSANEIHDVGFSIHLKQVAELDLSANHISNLTGLVLKRVLVLDLSDNEIREISVNFNENAPHLKKLNLSRNKIKALVRINSKSVAQIDLSYCRIATIDPKTFEGAESLIRIDLVGNKLTTLDFRIFKDLESVKELMLSRNQWACNCQAQEFKELYEFLTVDRPLTNVLELRCVRSNDTWRNTCLDAWHREKEWKKTVYSLTVSLAIALIVVAVIFFCKYFNDKKRMEETERGTRGRRENIGRRLSGYQDSTHVLHVTGEPEEIPNRSSTPPPAYEAALLLPKLTEAQRNLAISTLSVAAAAAAPVAGEETTPEAEESEPRRPQRNSQ